MAVVFGSVILCCFFWDKQLMMASTKHKQEREKSLCNYKDLCDRHMKDIQSAKTGIQKSGSNRCEYHLLHFGFGLSKYIYMVVWS